MHTGIHDASLPAVQSHLGKALDRSANNNVCIAPFLQSNNKILALSSCLDSRKNFFEFVSLLIRMIACDTSMISLLISDQLSAHRAERIRCGKEAMDFRPSLTEKPARQGQSPLSRALRLWS